MYPNPHTTPRATLRCSLPSNCLCGSLRRLVLSRLALSLQCSAISNTYMHLLGSIRLCLNRRASSSTHSPSWSFLASFRCHLDSPYSWTVRKYYRHHLHASDSTLVGHLHCVRPASSTMTTWTLHLHLQHLDFSVCTHQRTRVVYFHEQHRLKLKKRR